MSGNRGGHARGAGDPPAAQGAGAVGGSHSYPETDALSVPPGEGGVPARYYSTPGLDTAVLTVGAEALPPSEDGDELNRSTRYLPHLKHRNLRVSVTPGKTTIYGSVATYLHGTNAAAAGPADFERFMGEVGEDLGLPLWAVRAARVWRFDVAVNLPVSRPPRDYIALMEPPPGMALYAHAPHSITFRHWKRELAFYDKGIESRRKRTHSDPFRGQHALRAEVRFTKITEEFGGPILAEQLADPGFFEGLVGRWASYVGAVGMRRELRAESPRGVRELMGYLAIRGMEAEGGPQRVLDSISAARKDGDLTREQARVMRGRVRKLAKDEALTAEHDVAFDFKEALSRVRLHAGDA